MQFSNPSNRLRPDWGRGTSLNPPNRFEPVSFEQDDETERDADVPETIFYKDDSSGILTSNNSPDIPFRYSVNPYRGCEHGCVYCYARPSHEYLGFSSGSDFESRIMIKKNAADLLRKKLSSPSWKPEPVIFSGITDPYQPVEKKLEITRQCLSVLLDFRNPVSIITKNFLVTRDIDVLSELARLNLARVNISVTTLNPKLTDKLEPRTSRPIRRLETIRKLHEAGIPVGVMIAPVIPGLNDHEIPGILKAAAEAGASGSGYIMLRLPYVVKDLFADWLEHHYPDKKNKILSRITDIRQGKLNDSTFGLRMRGSGRYAGQISEMFKISARRYGLERERESLSTKHFIRRIDGQGELFE